MGFSYRKTIKAGPFRITASKSGVSYSAGVKGARITKRANGRVQTTLSVPGTGLRHTTTTGTRKAAPARPAARAVTAGQASARPVAAVRPPAPRPAPLPGQRSSVLPLHPPAGTAPLRFKGYLATVTLYPDRIQIDRTRAGRINGNTSAVIPWPQLTGVDFLDPTVLINGHAHFAAAGDQRGLTSTGNGNRMAAAARNPHAIMFTWQQKDTYHRLRALLMANAATTPPPLSPAGAAGGHGSTGIRPSVAGELSRLHDLYQRGGLTPAEFSQAKASLLEPGGH